MASLLPNSLRLQQVADERSVVASGRGGDPRRQRERRLGPRGAASGRLPPA